MATLKLHELPRPDSREKAVLETQLKDQDLIYLRGSGSLDLVCGVCGHTLVKGVSEARPGKIAFPDMVLHGKFVFFCNQCASYNEVRQSL